MQRIYIKIRKEVGVQKGWHVGHLSAFWTNNMYLFPLPEEEGQISEKITAFLWRHISEKKKNTDINQTVQLTEWKISFYLNCGTVSVRKWNTINKTLIWNRLIRVKLPPWKDFKAGVLGIIPSSSEQMTPYPLYKICVTKYIFCLFFFFFFPWPP